jgi:hypothetical protein
MFNASYHENKYSIFQTVEHFASAREIHVNADFLRSQDILIATLRLEAQCTTSQCRPKTTQSTSIYDIFELCVGRRTAAMHGVVQHKSQILTRIQLFIVQPPPSI